MKDKEVTFEQAYNILKNAIEKVNFFDHINGGYLITDKDVDRIFAALKAAKHLVEK